MKRSAHELSDDLGQSFRCSCMLGLHFCAAGEMKDDVQKLEFTIKALAMEDPFTNDPAMHDDIRECLAWQKGRSAEAIMRERESVTQLIEKNGTGYWQSGQSAEWFVGADPDVAYISREVNGPLWEEVVARCIMSCFGLFVCMFAFCQV